MKRLQGWIWLSLGLASAGSLIGCAAERCSTWGKGHCERPAVKQTCEACSRGENGRPTVDDYDGPPVAPDSSVPDTVKPDLPPAPSSSPSNGKPATGSDPSSVPTTFPPLPSQSKKPGGRNVKSATAPTGRSAEAERKAKTSRLDSFEWKPSNDTPQSAPEPTKPAPQKQDTAEELSPFKQVSKPVRKSKMAKTNCEPTRTMVVPAPIPTPAVQPQIVRRAATPQPIAAPQQENAQETYSYHNTPAFQSPVSRTIVEPPPYPHAPGAPSDWENDPAFAPAKLVHVDGAQSPATPTAAPTPVNGAALPTLAVPPRDEKPAAPERIDAHEPGSTEPKPLIVPSASEAAAGTARVAPLLSMPVIEPGVKYQFKKK